MFSVTPTRSTGKAESRFSRLSEAPNEDEATVNAVGVEVPKRLVDVLVPLPDTMFTAVPAGVVTGVGSYWNVIFVATNQG